MLNLMLLFVHFTFVLMYVSFSSYAENSTILDPGLTP